MKYYKLVLDKEIIGAITSNNFIRYSNIAQQFINCNEELGEYVDYQGKLYRSTWMRPIVQMVNYTSVIIIEISKEEYNAFAQAIKSNEKVYDTIKYEEEEEKNIYVDPIEQNSIEFIRSSKISEMSYACRTTIEKGFDLEINGETHHFSLDTQDQLNLMSLANLARTKNQIPYHADGEECVYYTAMEINQIVNAATQFKIYHTTYYNALKSYINALDSIKEISAITYGTPIPEEYKTDVLKTLE